MKYNEGDMIHLTLNLFGSVQIKMNGITAAGFDYAKMQALLAYLAVELGRIHQREAVAELFWPNKPEGVARNSLRQALAKLRYAIGDKEADPPCLIISRKTIQFNAASDCTVDVLAWTAVFTQINNHPHRQLADCKSCVKQLQQIAPLYRGDFLVALSLKDSYAFEEWLIIKRETFRRQAAQAYQVLAAYGEKRGAYEYAIPFARRHIDLMRWEEDPHRQLMRLLALNGQQSEALAQYEQCRQLLAQELDVEPSADTVALYKKIRMGLLPSTPPPPPANLPAPRTPFVGRQAEQDDIVRLLTDDPHCRLLTVVGAGGMGKTRLALEVARRITAVYQIEFPHGIYFIPMVDLTSPEQIANKVAAAIQFSFTGKRTSQAELIDYLYAKEMLLIVDNFEHLIDAASFLGEILANAPHVKLLVTSRERLHLYEEWAFPLSGLSYPKDGAAVKAEGSEAVQLFVQSARRAQARFALNADILPAVVCICQTLEGMPLAIELAAAWSRTLSCQQIADEAERGLDLLHASWRNFPKQHQSLRVVFDQSWQMLAAGQQLALCKLSLFGDGFWQAAAMDVAAADVAVLTALVDKSFLRYGDSSFDKSNTLNVRRYQMHPLLQRYAHEKWVAYSPELREKTAVFHAAHFAQFMFQQGNLLQSSHIQTALDDIELEAANVWRGWAWAVQRCYLDYLEQYLEGIFHFLEIRGRFREGAQMLGEAIARLEDGKTAVFPHQHRQLLAIMLNKQSMFLFRLSQYQQAETLVRKGLALAGEEEGSQKARAAGWHLLGHVSYGYGNYAVAEKQYRQSIHLSHDIGDQHSEAKALNSLSVITRLQGRYDEAQNCLRQSLSIFQEVGDVRHVAIGLNNLGTVLRILGNYDEARQCYEDCLSQRRAINDRNGIALTLNNLGNVASILKEYDTARYMYEESLAICQQMGERQGVARALNNMGIVAHAEGQYAEAVRYHLDSVRIKREIGDGGGMAHSYGHLGKAALAVGDEQQAWLYFQQALQTAVTVQSEPLMLVSLVSMAPLLETQISPALALAVVTMALQHSALSQPMREPALLLYERLGDGGKTAVYPQTEPLELDAMVQSILALEM